MRIFVALELSNTLQVALQQQIDTLRGQVPKQSVRWVNPTGMHLTLKFLGDVPAQQLSRIKHAVEAVARQHQGFHLQPEGLGCFPNLQKPRVVWVGLSGAVGTLQRLRDDLEHHIAPLGYPTEDRPFHPHLTLGRVKTQRPPEKRQIGHAIQAAHVQAFVAMSCHKVSIMQSELHPNGAVYTCLADYQLG